MLSLAVIARNEEDRLERCIRSVPAATEVVVVVDARSSDRTAEVAEACGARVVLADWRGFVGQKRFALSLTTQPWVLSLDADEWLSERAASEVSAALTDPGEAVGFSFPRCSEWLGTPLRHGRWYPDRKLRLVRRDVARWVGDDPHDRLEVDGAVTRLRGDILHVPYRTLRDHLGTIDRYSDVGARSLHGRGVRARWWDLALRPPLHFVDAYLRRGGMLDGGPGLAVASLGAAHVWLKWSRLRALERGGAR